VTLSEERVKPRSIYVEEAIQLALESRWQEALSTNQALLERHGADEDTYNRIGKALTELGRLDEALDAYKSALQLNPLNLIAQKNARKLSTILESKETVAGARQAIDVDVFTEEPGKSALTVLSPPAEAVSVKVAPADVVELRHSGDQLLAQTARGVPLGEVEPRLARRLIPLMETGNRYTAAVARVDDSEIEVIIREVFQAPENVGKPSFALAKTGRRDDFRPYAKDSLLASRGVDEEGIAGEDDEPYTLDASEPAEDLEVMGMSTFQAAEENAPETEADDDGHGRPEDEY
jgi:tetratricopeptide (TPR) repeat protein